MGIIFFGLMLLQNICLGMDKVDCKRKEDQIAVIKKFHASYMAEPMKDKKQKIVCCLEKMLASPVEDAMKAQQLSEHDITVLKIKADLSYNNNQMAIANTMYQRLLDCDKVKGLMRFAVLKWLSKLPFAENKKYKKQLKKYCQDVQQDAAGDDFLKVIALQELAKSFGDGAQQAKAIDICFNSIKSLLDDAHAVIGATQIINNHAMQCVRFDQDVFSQVDEKFNRIYKIFNNFLHIDSQASIAEELLGKNSMWYGEFLSGKKPYEIMADMCGHLLERVVRSYLMEDDADRVRREDMIAFGQHCLDKLVLFDDKLVKIRAYMAKARYYGGLVLQAEEESDIKQYMMEKIACCKEALKYADKLGGKGPRGCLKELIDDLNYDIGFCYSTIGQAKEALPYLQQVCKSFKYCDIANLYIGVAYYEQKRFAEAYEILKDLYQKTLPNKDDKIAQKIYVPVVANLAIICKILNKTEEAWTYCAQIIPELEHLVYLEPYKEAFLLTRAEIAFKLADNKQYLESCNAIVLPSYEVAIADYSKLLSSQQESIRANACLNLGGIYLFKVMHEDRFIKAKECLEQVLAMTDGKYHANAHAGLGVISWVNDDIMVAEQHFSYALANKAQVSDHCLTWMYRYAAKVQMDGIKNVEDLVSQQAIVHVKTIEELLGKSLELCNNLSDFGVQDACADLAYILVLKKDFEQAKKLLKPLFENDIDARVAKTAHVIDQYIELQAKKNDRMCKQWQELTLDEEILSDVPLLRPTFLYANAQYLMQQQDYTNAIEYLLRAMHQNYDGDIAHKAALDLSYRMLAVAGYAQAADCCKRALESRDAYDRAQAQALYALILYNFGDQMPLDKLGIEDLEATINDYVYLAVNQQVNMRACYEVYRLYLERIHPWYPYDHLITLAEQNEHLPTKAWARNELETVYTWFCSNADKIKKIMQPAH